MENKIIVCAIPFFFRLLWLQTIAPPVNNANVTPPSDAANGIIYSFFLLQGSDRQRYGLPSALHNE
ncbi:hypothetical protein IC575_003077 [Cucumis melo]